VLGAPTLVPVFKRSASGMRWATVHVSGDSRQPTDDLESQIEKASMEVSPGDAGAPGLEDEFLKLTTPPDSR